MSALEWHMSGSRLRDGTALPPDGETLRMDGRPDLGRRGYHTCSRLIDALTYSTGPIICRIRLSGTIIHDTDKMVASEQTIIWRIDGEALLHRFAQRCALDVIHLWDAPEIVQRYLRTGDESLKAVAGAAAWAAAGNAGNAGNTASVAVRAAAREAAEGAALATAGNVAAARAGEATAWAAAGEAALAATGGAALAAAGNAAAALAGEAAVRAAAWHAAKDAARTKQNRWLVAMVAAERRLRELPRDALPSEAEPA